MTRHLLRARRYLKPILTPILSVMVLIGCGDDSVNVTAPDGFRPAVPQDVVRALQAANYELIIQVSVDGKVTQTITGVRVDTESKSIEPISLSLTPGNHQLQLAYGAGRAEGCAVGWVRLAETLSKSITVEAGKETHVSFPESENQRAFDDDGDTFFNLDEVEANTSPCIASDRPIPGPSSTTTTTVLSVILNGLEFLSARLDQPFQPGQTSYTAHVTFPVDKIYAIASVESTRASIRINGITVESGKVSPPISLPQSGMGNPTTIKIDVTENGISAHYTVDITRPTTVFEQEAYLKASNTGAAPIGTPVDAEDDLTTRGDAFGSSLAISQDGQMLLVGSRYEDSGATSINGDQDSNDAIDAGAAYAFVRGGAWRQESYLKASNAQSKVTTDAGELPDYFGASIAMSGTGGTVAISAVREDSKAVGVNGDMSNNEAYDSGAVFVFANTNTGWQQTAYLKASNTNPFDLFGGAIVLSQNSNVLIVGANSEDSAATGTNGNEADNSASFSGAAYAYARIPGGWEQTSYIKASNTHAGALFADCFALSGDGNTLAVGSPGEKSNAMGVGGNQNNQDAVGAGAVYVYGWNGETWAQQAYIKASNTSAGDRFGCGLALSGDAAYLAVGAPHEGNGGIDGTLNNDESPDSGAVYIFHRSPAGWSQSAYIKSFNSKVGDRFGQVVRMSAEGSFLLVTAPYDDGDAAGINPDHNDNRVVDVGAAYLYLREGEKWNQQAYIKPSNGDVMDRFGTSAVMSADGSIISIGTILEDSASKGAGGDESNNEAVNSGAVYVFR